MFQNILALCNDNPAVVAYVLAFSNGVVKLKDVVKAIKDAQQIQKGQSTGAKNKGTAKTNLAEIVLTVANAVSAYAATQNDGDLEKAMHFTPSELERMRDEKLPAVAANVRGIANPLLAELADFGITSHNIDDLDAAITAFDGKSTDPATIRANKKVATENIKKALKDGDKILTDILDKLVNQLAAKDTEFVKKYKELREIDDAATRHTAISGFMYNETTGEPIYNAEFVIVGGNSVKSDLKGKYSVRHDEGEVKCRAEKQGFITKNLDNVILEKGKITKLDIKLKPE